jgi:hypothetical protein
MEHCIHTIAIGVFIIKFMSRQYFEAYYAEVKSVKSRDRPDDFIQSMLHSVSNPFIARRHMALPGIAPLSPDMLRSLPPGRYTRHGRHPVIV